MFMYKTSKFVYVFSVDCMHFSLFLDTLGYNFLHKYIYIYFFLNIFGSAEGQEVLPHSFDIAFDIYAYIYIYYYIYTDRARSRIVFRAWDSSIARYPAADFVVCRALRRGGCGYPSSTHAVFPRQPNVAVRRT